MDFVLRVVRVSGLLCTAAFATTLEVAQNFNAANSPVASGAFSYGTGTSASFTALPNLAVNCFGTPSDCLDNGLSFPNSSQVTWNGTGSSDSYSTIVQPANELRLDPQSSQAIVRFTVPNASTFAVEGLFQGIDSGQHSTNVAVFVNGESQFGDTITGFGQQKTFNLSGLVLSSGDHVDFIARKGLVAALSVRKQRPCESATQAPFCGRLLESDEQFRCIFPIDGTYRGNQRCIGSRARCL